MTTPLPSLSPTHLQTAHLKHSNDGEKQHEEDEEETEDKDEC